MYFNKLLTDYNLKRVNTHRNHLLVISLLMFALSLIINDNIEIKIMHFILIILFISLNYILTLSISDKTKLLIYVYSISIWGLLRLFFYSNRIITHTPYIGIMMSITFIYTFTPKNRIIYYFSNYFISILLLIFTINNKIDFAITYLCFFIISFYINKNNYLILLDNIKKENKIRIYDEKLNRQYKILEKDFKELYEAYPKILDFLSHSNVNEFDHENKFLKSTFRLFSKLIIEADYGSIYIIENNKVHFIDTIGHDYNELRSLKFNSKPFEVETNSIHIINNIIKNKFLKKEDNEKHIKILKKASLPIEKTLLFHVDLPNSKKICISLDIKKDSPLVFSDLSLRKIRAFENIIRTYYKNLEFKESFTTDIAKSLTNLLRVHDSYTLNHSDNVANLSVLIAKKLGLSKNEIQDTYYASLLHDIGKTIIPKTIINKQRKLSIVEFRIIKDHPIIGYNATKDLKNLASIAKYIRHHHERYDGNGYPDQLSKNEIPLISRIITAADSYDAMISARPYRSALTKKKAINELLKCKGTHFDPDIIDILVEIINNK